MESLIEHFARDIEIQVMQPVADVHQHAGFFGVAHLRPEFAIAIEQTAGMHGEHMRDDVAGAEIFEHVADVHRGGVFGPALADMN